MSNELPEPTPEQIAGWRRSHREFLMAEGYTTCENCLTEWPCDWTRLLNALQKRTEEWHAANRDRAALTEEAAHWHSMAGSINVELQKRTEERDAAQKVIALHNSQLEDVILQRDAAERHVQELLRQRKAAEAREAEAYQRGVREGLRIGGETL